jgi:hypothetical protein
VYTSPNIAFLITGCLLVVVAIVFIIGIFVPGLRGRWGKRGQGAQMSLLSQVVWSVIFIFAAGGVLASAFHRSWSTRFALPVFCLMFFAMFAMLWYDNYARKS